LQDGYQFIRGGAAFEAAINGFTRETVMGGVPVRFCPLGMTFQKSQLRGADPVEVDNDVEVGLDNPGGLVGGRGLGFRR